MDPVKWMLTLGVLVALSAPLVAGQKVVLCYVMGWAGRRPDKFTVLDADSQHCTHVVYAFMGVNDTTNAIKYYDRVIDLDAEGKRLYQINRLKTLKERSPHLKVLASIKAGSRKFSELLHSPQRRQALVRNIKKTAKERSLDGIDICWQFPGAANGGLSQDKANALTFFRELKQAFKPDGLLLTVHLLGKRHAMDEYDIRGVSETVDYISLAAMEYSGVWDRKSGIMAPLDSVEASVEYVLSRGASPGKLLLGLPFYGRAYVLNTAPSVSRYKDLPVNGTFQSPRTREGGFIAFSEMCHNVKNTNGWTQHWDSQSRTPVAFNGNKYVTYENVASLQLKVDLVGAKSLAGLMLWSLDLDDFRGTCGGGKFPLTTFVSDYVNRLGSRPGQGTSRPGQGTSRPGQGTSRPGQGTSRPGQGTSRPGQGTGKPVLTPLSIDSSPSQQALGTHHDEKVFLCYMVSWAYNRPSQGRFRVEDAKNEHCTHIVWAFVHLDEGSHRVTLDSPANRDELSELKSLKTTKRGLKVLASVGGYSQGSRRFSLMAATRESRQTFIRSLLNFINEYELDGIDICWQFPGLRDGRPVDKDNSLMLLREIKAAFKPFDYLLTVHVLGHRYVVDAFQIKPVSETVDFINFAAMEYHGSWENTTQVATPLTSSDNANVKVNLDYLLSKGVSPSKVLLGLPTFGHAYSLPEAPRGKYIDVHYDHLVGGLWTREDGIIAYNELCYEMYGEDSEWTEDWEEFSQTPIAYNGNFLASYEDEKSLRFKAKLVEQKRLAGVMIWSLDMDDFNAACKKSKGRRYPLLAAVAEVVSPRHSTIAKPSATGNNTACVVVSSNTHSSILNCDYGSL